MQLTTIVQTVGGIVALLNDRRIRNGKRALGFLNPMPYDEGIKDTDLEGVGINDITSGSNRGCGKTSAFYAVDGWDPVCSAMLVSLYSNAG